MKRLGMSCAVLSALAVLSAAESKAAGFALQEQSAAGLGNAYAGAAAVAEDASTVWWNPAGMTLLNGITVTGALHSITPSSKFSNGNSQPACVAPTVCRPLGGNGGDAGDTAYVPNL